LYNTPGVALFAAGHATTGNANTVNVHKIDERTPMASVDVKLAVKDPTDAVTVPVMLPLPASTSPVGSAPAGFVYVNGDVPPFVVTTICCPVYVAPVSTLFCDGHTICGAGFTCSKHVAAPTVVDPVTPLESVTVTVYVKFSATADVPLSTPPVVNVMPAGNDAGLTGVSAYVYAGVP